MQPDVLQPCALSGVTGVLESGEQPDVLHQLTMCALNYSAREPCALKVCKGGLGTVAGQHRTCHVVFRFRGP